jgi:glycosyltransferase involved in cell wall biosynthesis
LVSIVVPVFNAERYLRASLDSIVGQSYSPVEIIVMDDGSTDTSADIIRSYKDRVKVHRQARNRGQFDNVNDGIALATGEYIAVYHADDIYDANIVDREVAFLLKYPEAGAVFCLDIFIDSMGHECGRLHIPPEVRGGRPLDYSVILNALLSYKNTFLCGPASMVRSRVYKNVGGYRGSEFGIAADLEMWVRIAEKYPIGILEDYLLRYRFGHGNLTQNYYRLRTEVERHFGIMDLYLERGGKKIATDDALKALEAHRAEDQLMVAANHYIIGRQADCRAILSKVKASQIRSSNKVQSWRLLILFFVLKVLTRLPRINAVADIFHRRWHLNKYAALTRRAANPLAEKSSGTL